MFIFKHTLNTGIPLDKIEKATGFSLYLEPRFNINDDFILGLRFVDFHSINGISPKGYDIDEYIYQKDTLIYYVTNEALNYLQTFGLICDYKISEQGKSRLFIGGSIFFIDNYRSSGLGLMGRVSHNFGHLRSGLSINYVGSEFPFHAALQFGFEISGGLRKKNKLKDD